MGYSLLIRPGDNSYSTLLVPFEEPKQHRRGGKESHMYLCFKLTDLDGDMVPNPPSFLESEEPTQGMICLDMDGPILNKHLVINDTGDYHLDLLVGWLNIPRYRFNQRKWDASEDPFEPIDAMKSQRIKHYVRRERINAEINIDLNHQTELKKHRKALKAVIAALPQLADLPEIAEFGELSDTIEGKIAAHAKSENYFDAIDLRRETGITSEERKI